MTGIAAPPARHAVISCLRCVTRGLLHRSGLLGISALCRLLTIESVGIGHWLLRHPATLRDIWATELRLLWIGSIGILLIPGSRLSRPCRICCLCRLLGVSAAGLLRIGVTVAGITLLGIGLLLRISVRILHRALSRIAVLHGLLRRIAVLYGLRPSGVDRLLSLYGRLILCRPLRITGPISGRRILRWCFLRGIGAGGLLGNRITGGRYRLLRSLRIAFLLLIKEAHFVAG